MSLRSNSPWTSTSSPSSSWSFKVRVICSAMNASYSGPVSLPSCSCLRAARTSAVWGNDPMVVVGKSGRRSCLRRRSPNGERALVRLERRRRGLPSVTQRARQRRHVDQLLFRERQPSLELAVEPPLEVEIDRDMEQRARRRHPELRGAGPLQRVLELAQRRGEICPPDVAPVDHAERQDFASPPAARRPRLE